MKVFGLQAPIYRFARLASRIGAETPSFEAAMRDDILRRWRQARQSGLTAVKAAAAVGVPPSTLYRWHKTHQHGGPKALTPASRRPIKVRRRSWSPAVLAEIEALRAEYPLWGKKKIVVLLARAGHTVSESTVGRMLAHLIARGAIAPAALFRAQAPRSARRKRPFALRLPKGARPTAPGEILQLDTLTITLRPGHVVKQFTAYDPVAKWTAAEAFRSASATNAKAFLERLLPTLPFAVKAIQVDGGSEFKAVFEQECKRRGLTLYELPPKTPELNGHVERNQATWRYEFYAVYELPQRIEDLNPMIEAFAHLHNTFRPHNALGGRTPTEYLFQQAA
jgi:transposase InsO family protein